MKKLYKNAKIYNTDERVFKSGSLLVADGVIEAVLPESCVGIIGLNNVEDMKGARIIPGMIDIHTHGHGGFESTDTDGEGMIKLAKSYASVGTTSFMMTMMSVPFEKLEAAIDAGIYAKENRESGCANILGTYLEGRFISLAKKGAHLPENIKPHNADELASLIERAKPLGSFYTICAPEMPGTIEFIDRAIELGAIVAIGHTDATAEKCLEALEHGATAFTHLYNAMSPLKHREPGCVGAAFASDAYAELICDGVHVDKIAVKAAYRAKGVEKTAIITDSAPSAGLPEGNYRMGGSDVVVRDGAVFLLDGTLTGGSISMFEAMKNLAKFADIPLEDAIVCASANPAKLVGAYDRVGSLEGGKLADFLVLDECDEISRIVVGGAELE